MTDNRKVGDVAFSDFLKQQIIIKSPLELLKDEARRLRQGITRGAKKAGDAIEYGVGYAIGTVSRVAPVDITKAKGFVKESASWVGGKKFQDKLIDGIEKKSPRVASWLRSFQALDQQLGQWVKGVISKDAANIRRGIQAAKANTH